MQNAIIQIYVPAKGWEEEQRLDWQNDEVLMLSRILVSEYAKKFGIYYELITEPVVNFKHPTWERFQLFDEKWVNQFDNILYLDTDVFTWPWAPNIFELFDKKALNVAHHQKKKLINGNPGFNAGVMGINKEVYNCFKKFISKELWLKSFEIDPKWEDGKELNKLAYLSGVKINWLDTKWNFKNYPEAYFTHMLGGLKKSYPNMSAIVKARKIVNSNFKKI